MGRVLKLDDKFVESGETKLKGLFVSSDDNLWVHSILNEAFCVFEEFSSDDGNAGCS